MLVASEPIIVLPPHCEGTDLVHFGGEGPTMGCHPCAQHHIAPHTPLACPTCMGFSCELFLQGYWWWGALACEKDRCAGNLCCRSIAIALLKPDVPCMQNIDIVVAGDSMMRQHFTRLVQLLRGRQRNVDYRVHTHGSYSYCDEVTHTMMCHASAQH